jgi:hypothetical protein
MTIDPDEGWVWMPGELPPDRQHVPVRIGKTRKDDRGTLDHVERIGFHVAGEWEVLNEPDGAYQVLAWKKKL